LWQKEFTSILKKLGFEDVPREPCCMIKQGVIIFFYVDDVIVAYPKGQQQKAESAIQ
jgi:hypothetical protein